MVGREIIEVLYSPVNAFRKIIEKPDFKGVLFILLLVIFSTVVLQLVYNTKQYYETRVPTNDSWTEALTNQHIWTSNGILSLDSSDYQMANISISSSVLNETIIWLKLTGIESINCLDSTSYNELFFWINWTNENGSPARSGTIKLFSENEDSYFETNLDNFLDSSGEWINVTLGVGSNQEWSLINSPDWQNITGIEFRLVWVDSSNAIMKIDGLFFRNFVSPIESVGIGEALVYIFLSVTFSIGINWILWAGILIIVSKLFGEELGQWNTFFVIIGHALIVTAIYTLVSALIFTSLPILNMPIDTDLQITAFSEVWLPTIAYQAGTLILWVGEVWIAALAAVVIRLMKNLPWGKAATIALVAFGLRFILRFFLGA
jgi:hypothetical protein